MRRFAINTETSYGDLENLKDCIQSSHLQFERAILNVRQMPTASEDPKDWPLILEANSDGEPIRIYVHTLTCGYRGTGPHDLVECLKVAGFKGTFEEEELYTNKEVRMVLVKK